jgi:hypothetical protein
MYKQNLRAAMRKLVQTVNTGLGRWGLRIGRIQRDFDYRPLDAFTRGRIIADMAGAYRTWLARQSVFDAEETFDGGRHERFL